MGRLISATGYVRQSASEIVTGSTILASSLNNEYNQLASAFDATTGHDHSGGSGLGQPISLTSAVAGILPASKGGTGVNNTGTITLGGNLTLSGAFTFTGTITANTSVTFPTSGTLVNSVVTSLSSLTTASALTTIGTIGTGVWQATDVDVPYGGTGLSSLTAHSLIIGNGTSAPLFLAPSTSGNIVISNGTDWTSAAQTNITKTGTITTGTWNGTKINLAYGGTNSDLSSTGGTSQVLMQSTVGGNITVAQLAASNLSDGTSGTGNIALVNTPTLITPNIGVATATSVNKVTITAPASSATLTLATGSSLITSGANSITLTSTSTTNVTLPTTGTLVNTAVTTLSSLVSIGTITTGTWNGTVIGVVYGGTGLATLTANNVMLGNGTSTPNFVAPGSSGNILTSNGTTWASAAPAAGTLTLISTQTASSSASIDFTGALSSSYTKYIIECIDVVPSAGASFSARVNTGSGYLATSTYRTAGLGRGHETTGLDFASSGATQIEMSAAATVDTTIGGCWKVEIINPSHSKTTRIRIDAAWRASGIDREFWGSAVGENTTTSPITGIQFLFASGNITSGTFKLYGVQ